MDSATPPRDLIGYGPHPPHPQWPNGARIALSLVINHEAGAERCILNGDPTSENIMAEMGGFPLQEGRRSLMYESMYEYGSRAGIWRLLRILEERQLPCTVFAVGLAAKLQPEATRAMAEAGHEIAAHHWRWIAYEQLSEDVEREHIRLAVEAITETAGKRPVGFFAGQVSINTRRLVIEEGGFLYDNDAVNDELPYYVPTPDGRGHLIVPYGFDTNDQKFYFGPSFGTGGDFFEYLRDSFDVLYAEGETAPKMMSVGLHPRLAGHPGRAAGLMRFLDHVQKHDGVWICRREEIARHWREHFPYKTSIASP